VDSSWTATAHVQNVGSGKMPVEVAAVAGERFDKDGAASPDYRDARAGLVLGANEEADVRIDCAFKPERIVVDPDAKVLQLRRKLATAGL